MYFQCRLNPYLDFLADEIQIIMSRVRIVNPLAIEVCLTILFNTRKHKYKIVFSWPTNYSWMILYNTTYYNIYYTQYRDYMQIDIKDITLVIEEDYKTKLFFSLVQVQVWRRKGFVQKKNTKVTLNHPLPPNENF